MPSQKPLNIGLVGYGFMGRTHPNAYKRVNDFFDVASHPTWTFTSTAIRPVSATEWKVDGDLTIRGVTKSVTLLLGRQYMAISGSDALTTLGGIVVFTGGATLTDSGEALIRARNRQVGEPLSLNQATSSFCALAQVCKSGSWDRVSCVVLLTRTYMPIAMQAFLIQPPPTCLPIHAMSQARRLSRLNPG